MWRKPVRAGAFSIRGDMDIPARPNALKRLSRSIQKMLTDKGYLLSPDRVDSTDGVTDEYLSANVATYKEATLSLERHSVYRDMDEIDNTMPEGSRALDVLADNAVNAEGGGLVSFQVSFEGRTYKNYLKIIEDMIERARLREKMYAIARDAAKYGDNFQQIVISDAMRIERLMYMPPESMRRFEDAHGLLLPGNEKEECAYGQFDPDTDKFIAGFYPWQIFHFRWNRSGALKYGRPQLLSARHAWIKLQAMQEALVINWLTRAFVRLLFELDVTGKKPAESQQYLREFMQQLERRVVSQGYGQDKPMSVAKDIALGNSYQNLNGTWQPSLNKVSVLDTSNSGFWNITAIEYWRTKFISATGVPKAHLGLEQDVHNRSTLQWQDERFARTIRRIQSMLSEFIAHLINLELTLHGLDPRRVPYRIDWAPPSTLDLAERAGALQAIGQAAGPLINLGIVDPMWIRTNALHMTTSQAQALGELPIQQEPAP